MTAMQFDRQDAEEPAPASRMQAPVPSSENAPIARGKEINPPWAVRCYLFAAPAHWPRHGVLLSTMDSHGRSTGLLTGLPATN